MSKACLSLQYSWYSPKYCAKQALDICLTIWSLPIGLASHNIKLQCCQVAAISAKKLKRGRRKIKLAGRICGRILAEFYLKWQKMGRKVFSKEIPYLTVLTHF
jgi:hypothetical protein